MFRFFKRKHNKKAILSSRPDHVAVIMDGNGRWANARGMTRVAGHKQGVNSVKSLIKSCITYEIPYLTIFAFSSENWSRPESEVSTLMDLLATALETQTKKLKEHGTQLKLMGDLSKFSPQIQELANKAQQEVPDNINLHFSVAINYGGRWDITQACRKLADKVAAGEMNPEQITESTIAEQLSTSGMPDPDFYIRTSGEYRLSNFMLWQAAYSEFYFTDILWPDFDEKAFDDALLQYANRERRFGSANDQVSEQNKNEETVSVNDKKAETTHA